MAVRPYVPIGSLRDADAFVETLRRLQLDIPFDAQLLPPGNSPLGSPVAVGGVRIGNRFAIQPMEGWDGTPDGRPSDNTFRRWRHFGTSGAKLIWGGEAFAVRFDGRANPNQLCLNEHSTEDLARLRQTLVDEHRRATGSTAGLLIGLQLTHSGRYSVPAVFGKREPKILYHHPLLDRRVGLTNESPVLGDDEIGRIIAAFADAARVAADAGFDFVDIKHCHGYLGHEFLSAHTREGEYGGSFENRTRFLQEVVQAVQSVAPRLQIGVRVSVFDSVPFRPDPAGSQPGKPGIGVPEPFQSLLPYRWGFGLNPQNPLEIDLTEPIRFLSMLRDLGIRLVNVTGGNPYANPHLQRPALYPPSDGYQPPEDPLVGVARQMRVTRDLKRLFPDLFIVGSGYTYLQDFLPKVAQAAVREGWVDLVGLGRMVLAYPQLPIDVLSGRPLQTKKICRTFSDCTTAPRNSLPSGCYPLDAHYKQSVAAAQLKDLKAARRF